MKKTIVIEKKTIITSSDKSKVDTKKLDSGVAEISIPLIIWPPYIPCVPCTPWPCNSDLTIINTGGHNPGPGPTPTPPGPTPPPGPPPCPPPKPPPCPPPKPPCPPPKPPCPPPHPPCDGGHNGGGNSGHNGGGNSGNGCSTRWQWS